MTAQPVADLSVERLVRIDQSIDAHETDGLRARWEFGRLMLAERDKNGGKKLPPGYLTALCERTGKSRTELTYRAQFAEKYPTEDSLLNALSNGASWFETTKTLKKEADAEPTYVEPTPVDGTFSTIVADPPWQYGNTSTRGAAEDHYPTMTIEELCALDVARERAAEQSHLYLWATAGHLPEAFRVMESWGFEYKTYLVWAKPQMGMGNYFRVSTELVLFGIRGGLRTRTRDTMNYFTVGRGKHSSKPEQFYDLVERNSPGPYLELFARCVADTALLCRCNQCHRGWTTWGNQS